jgi:hypothetical protein
MIQGADSNNTAVDNVQCKGQMTALLLLLRHQLVWQLMYVQVHGTRIQEDKNEGTMGVHCNSCVAQLVGFNVSTLTQPLMSM